MRISLASDHGGFRLKEALKQQLEKLGHEVHDLGTVNGDSVDYPDYAIRVAQEVSAGRAERGLLVCGTGIGMSIAANKVHGVRAALVHDLTTAKLAAQHNNANVLCLGGRLVATELAAEMVETWLTTPFETRHQRRLDKIAELEQEEA